MQPVPRVVPAARGEGSPVSDAGLRARLALLTGSGQFEEAEELALTLLAERPDDPDARYAYGVSLCGQMEFGRALQEVRQGLRQTASDFVRQHLFLREFVLCCAQLGQIDMARELIEAYRPVYMARHGADLSWPGIYLWMLGLTREALESHEAALAAQPDDNSYLVHQMGMVRMCLGDREGMAQYRNYTSKAFWDLYYPEPNVDRSRMWEGESLEGKSILVRPHGGVGDYIQFVRYARILRESGAREVILALPSERIRGVFQSVPDVRIGSIGELHTADCWTSIFGLCCHLFLAHGPMATQRYLAPPPSRLADAQLALSRKRAAGRRCIAIAWHSDMSDGSLRSVPLGTLLPLFGLPNVHWVITQRGVALRQFMRAGLNSQCSVVGETSTFDETAALFAGLDGVVTIDSYSLHLAGSMGVPTWFLAGRSLDWRHFNEEIRSVWYPSVRLVRQPAAGDWRSVVQDLRQQLLAL
jgi:tetratricopeptide (TPR) repeat protein